MILLKELFSDWVGILSFLVIFVTLSLGGYYLNYFMKKSAEAEAEAGGAARGH